jgi:hypothetical protein
LAEHRWRTPLITTAYAHLEVFAVAPLEPPVRRDLMARAQAIFRARWSALLHQEAASFRLALPRLITEMAASDGVAAGWMARQLTDAIRAVETILPEQDFTVEHLEIAAMASEGGRRKAA